MNKLKLTLSSIALTGLTVGLTTAAICSVPASQSTPINSTQPNSLYVTLIFQPDGGTIDGESTMRIRKNTPFAQITPPTASKPNFTFSGWSLTQYGHGTQTPIAPTATFTENTTIWPIWSTQPIPVVSNNYTVLIDGTEFIVDEDSEENLYPSGSNPGIIHLTSQDGSQTKELHAADAEGQYAWTTDMPLIIGDQLSQLKEGFLYNFTNFNSPIIFTDATSLIHIGDAFMYGCSSFNQPMLLPQNLKFIGQDFMQGCISFAPENDPSTLINESIIYLPSSITFIRNGFLANCDNFSGGVDVGGLSSEVFEESNNSFSHIATDPTPANVPMFADGITIYADDSAVKDDILMKFNYLHGQTSSIGYLWRNLQNNNFVVGDLIYSINEDGLSATCLGMTDDATITNVVIPAKVIINQNEYNVTKIGDNAFADKTQITSLTLANNIEEIGTASFAGCTSLTNIILQNDRPFVARPEGLGSYAWGNNCFNNIATTGTITVADTINSWETYHLWKGWLENFGLTGVYPSDVTGTGNWKLTTALTGHGSDPYASNQVLPVTANNFVVSNSYNGTDRLTITSTEDQLSDVIIIPKEVEALGNNFLLSDDGDTPSAITKVVFEGGYNSTTSRIANTGAFTSEILTNIDFNNSSISEFADAAFVNSAALTNVVLPATTTKIGINCFSLCYALKTVDFSTISASATTVLPSGVGQYEGILVGAYQGTDGVIYVPSATQSAWTTALSGQYSSTNYPTISPK